MITRNKLQQNVDKTFSETKSALQTVFDALNQGQQKKIMKAPEVKALFERYGIVTDS